MSRPMTSRQNSSPPGSPQGRQAHTSASGTFASPASPRSSFLGFMRTRSRAASVTNAVAGAVRGRVASPTVEHPNPLGDTGDAQRSASARSEMANIPIPPVDPALRRTHRIRLVPILESNRSFTFAPVVREVGVMHVPPGVLPSIAAAATEAGPLVNGRPPPLLMKIGRFTDRVAAAANAAPAVESGQEDATQDPPGDGADAAGTSASAQASGSRANGRMPTAVIAPSSGGGGGDLLSSRAAFKSKVVSRSHAEIWCEPGGKFFIHDTASSSGTFLNHIRLSSPNVNSRPQHIQDGDVIQLGVDYQGGAEEMFRCVKMRVEIGREWQRSANEFNTNALKQLRTLGGVPDKPEVKEKQQATPPAARKAKASVTDCCICLFSVTVCQSLFIAPCSHVFHYKCIRPLLNQHWPGFSCPLCRTYANLEEDVETEDAWEIASRKASVRSRRNSRDSARVPVESLINQAEEPAAVPAPPEILEAAAPATIDEIIASSSERNSRRTSADVDSLAPGSSSRADLARQITAVSPGAGGGRGTLAPETDSGRDTPVSSNADDTVASISHATSSPMGIDNHTPTRADTGTTSCSLAQTPMNDVFLSTLALSNLTVSPSMGRVQDSSLPPSATGSGATSRISHEIVEEPIAEAAAADDEDFELEGVDNRVRA